MAGAEFVDGWFVAGVLGEGAYGEVRLLVHGRSRARVALKAVRGAAGAREAALHGALRHPHVLRLLGTRPHAPADLTYLFLEWAAGGELFTRIEPDAGTGEARARRYWRQLLAALRYLHARGVAHRDVKPENLLLAADGRLLLADFGLATLFAAGGRERLLARPAGTPPYAAPEVAAAAAAPYRAPPADLWSAAVVLVAMLAGELPWERAADDEPRYRAWAAAAAGAAAAGAAAAAGPWRRVPAAALALLRRALQPEPARRYSLQQLLAHPWTRLADPPRAESEPSDGDTWSSQPLPDAALPAAAELASLSQPAAGAGGAGAGAGAGWAGGGGARLWVRGGAADALRAAAAAGAARGWARRRRGRVLLLEAGGATLRLAALACTRAAALLDARRAAGCGLQFRRRWAELCAALAPLHHRAADHPADECLHSNSILTNDEDLLSINFDERCETD